MSCGSFRITIQLGLTLLVVVTLATANPPGTWKSVKRQSPLLGDEDEAPPEDELALEEPPEDICGSLIDSKQLTENVTIFGSLTVLFKKNDEDNWELEKIRELKQKMTKRQYHNQFVLILSIATPPEKMAHLRSWAESAYDNIQVMYETEDVEHLAPNSVTILDSCARIVYSIFAPWSSLQFPYTKAAILSTTFDQPCGPCDKASVKPPALHPLFEKTNQNREVELTFTEKESRHISDEDWSKSATSVSPGPEGEDSNYLVPLRVIIPAEHVHRDSENPFGRFKKYNYYVLKTDDHLFHGHLDTDEPEIVGVWRDLDAGFVSEEPEIGKSSTLSPSLSSSTATTTEDLETIESSTLTTTLQDDRPLFGFPGTGRITFTSTNDIEISRGTTTPLSSTESPPSTTDDNEFPSSTQIDPLTSSKGDQRAGNVQLESTSSSTIVTTTVPPQGNVEEPSVAPLVYFNDQKDKFKVRKKYRFGDSYNPRNFDEVEILRDAVKTFIRQPEVGPAGEEDEAKEARNIEEHYGSIISWLDFNLD